jgi:hypothetical protein
MKLRDILPKEFFLEHMVYSTTYVGVQPTPAARLLDVEVKVEHHGVRQSKSFKKWTGEHKNVQVWWELKNGKVVGWNEGRDGWAFPVTSLNKKAVTKLLLWRVPEDDGDVYACAVNGRKAVNLIHRAGYGVAARTLAKYGTNDWGNAMKKIAPEPGVWIVRSDGEKPERLI